MDIHLSAGSRTISLHANHTAPTIAIRLVLRLYQWLWHLILPGLRLNVRLKAGYDQRTLRVVPPRADLWLQAASVGEAYLAWQLVKTLQPPAPRTVLITTNTSQGFDILRQIKAQCRHLRVEIAYFPFDQPSLMKRALAAISPKVVVLLEGELWPGLMAACKEGGSRLLVINGRMTQRSLQRYLRWPTIWRALRPQAVLAMSEADGRRFAALFGADIVSTMANIKFDRLQPPAEEVAAGNPLRAMIDEADSFIVLGSIRQEEEAEVAQLLTHLASHNSHLIIGLFPRHMHRLPHWQQELERLALPWQLRSTCHQRVRPGTVLLWDTMGELTTAYELARSAFIGGSLAPVGGQNFLEPLSCGIRPVIGPHWSNFAWVGRKIIDQGLVHEASDWHGVAAYLLHAVEHRPDRRQTQEELGRFIKSRQGGSQTACRKIMAMLNEP